MAANQNNDIVALRIQSPFDLLFHSRREWKATVVGHFHVDFEQSRDDLSAFTFDDHLQQQRYVSNLALSPWTRISESTHCAYLAYTTRNAVVVRRVHLDLHSGSELRVSFHDRVSKIPLDGPITTTTRWVPKRTARGDLWLVTHAGRYLYCLEISVSEDVERKRYDYILDDEWNHISGKPS